MDGRKIKDGYLDGLMLDRSKRLLGVLDKLPVMKEKIYSEIYKDDAKG